MGVSLIELIWTITPALILSAIAFPSFNLLYMMDNPSLFPGNAGTIECLLATSTSISRIVSRSTEVVPFGVTGGINNFRLNKHSRDITVFNSEIISQLVGHLLGDGSLLYTRTSITP